MDRSRVAMAERYLQVNPNQDVEAKSVGARVQGAGASDISRKAIMGGGFCHAKGGGSICGSGSGRHSSVTDTHIILPSLSHCQGFFVHIPASNFTL